MKRLLVLLALLFGIIGSAFGAVNVNTAGKEALQSLKGIGPAKAQAIIDYRAKHGPFKTVDDLEKVQGIGAKTLEAIRKDVTVTGASTGVAAKSAPAASATKAPEPAKGAAPAKPAEPAKDDAKKVTAKADTAKADAKPASDKKAEAAKADKRAGAKDAKAGDKEATKPATK